LPFDKNHVVLSSISSKYVSFRKDLLPPDGYFSSEVLNIPSKWVFSHGKSKLRFLSQCVKV